MRVVIDTNVFISGLISKPESPPAKVLNMWHKGDINPVVTPDIIKEYRRVIRRDKFKCIGSLDERVSYLKQMLQLDNAFYIDPSFFTLYHHPIVDAIEDKEDLKFIEAAWDGCAHFLITGDPHLYKIRRPRPDVKFVIQDPRILQPADFIKIIN